MGTASFTRPPKRGAPIAARHRWTRARAEEEVNNTDARLWHPWLRINRVLRVMLHTRWSPEGRGPWSESSSGGCSRSGVRSGARAGSTRLVTEPPSRGAVLVRIVAFS